MERKVWVVEIDFQEPDNRVINGAVLIMAFGDTVVEAVSDGVYRADEMGMLTQPVVGVLASYVATEVLLPNGEWSAVTVVVPAESDDRQVINLK